MEVKIGVQDVARELVVHSPLSPDEVEQVLATALAQDQGLFSLTSEDGQRVIVPVDKLAYLDLGEQQPRRVGFG